MKKNKIGLGIMTLGACALISILTPVATAANIMTLQCEDYRDGANAPGGTDTDYTVYSYYDTTAGSQSGLDYAGRNAAGDDVDFAFAGNDSTPNKRALGYVAFNEWFYMSGDTNSPWSTDPVFSQTATYRITARIASGNTAVEKYFKIYIDGVLEATVPVQYTGGTGGDDFELTTTVTTTNIISAGSHKVKFHAGSGNYNIDWVSFEAIPPAVMTLQCEDYRDGTNALNNPLGTGNDSDYTTYSYYDTTVGSQSGLDYAGRNAAGDDVDFGGLPDGNRSIGYVAFNEWFYMSGNTDSPWNLDPYFSETATYRITARIASGNTGVEKYFRIYIDGVLEATVPVQYTGGTADANFELTTTVVTSNSISAGPHKVKFHASSGNYNVDWVSFEAVSAVPPGYEGWATNYNLVEPETGDDDNDGLSNIYEYGLGGDPTNALDQGTSPVFGIENDGGTNTFGYIHPQLAATNSGITYHLELNTDLVAGTWINAGYLVIGTNDTGGELDFVTNVTSTVEDEKFIRLIIESL